MALPKIFKKEETEKREPLKKEAKTEIKKAPKENKSVSGAKRKKSGNALLILKSPRITEKATDLAEKNQYIFNVWPGANKTEIKKAVEDVYGINVISVKIINIHRKKIRLGKTSGFKKGYKKAIVKLAKGQKIEVLPR